MRSRKYDKSLTRPELILAELKTLFVGQFVNLYVVFSHFDTTEWNDKYTANGMQDDLVWKQVTTGSMCSPYVTT
jgi:hypothetical protein